MDRKLTTLKSPYLLFLGDVKEDALAKTAFGLLQWCPEKCVGQMRLNGCSVNLGLEETSPLIAKETFGAGTLVIGVANLGGILPDSWINALCEALEAGLDLAAGLHTRLNDNKLLRETAEKYGRTMHDVRQSDMPLNVGTGLKRTGKRLLTVGTDCAVGKKYTALALTKEMQARNLKADFRATGQTGILISGSGISIDAVVADFISGAAEAISPSNNPDHWDIIEGQGSLFHPAYAGVSLGLLHGSQPDALVLCHDASRSNIAFIDGFPIPDIKTAIRRNEEAASLTNAGAQVVGISVNTTALSNDAALAYMNGMKQQFNLPVCDPIRTGTGDIVDHLMAINLTN